MLSRKLQGLEKVFAPCSFVQFALKFNDPQSATKAAKNFQKIYYCLRLKATSDDLVQINPSKDIVKLPDWITNCKSACMWMSQRINPPSKVLGSIAVNKNIVVVNASHAIHDSGFHLQAMSHCLDDSIKGIPVFPNIMEEPYAKEIAQALEDNPQSPKYSDCIPLYYDTNIGELYSPNSQNDSLDYIIPSSKLTCFDRKLNRPTDLSQLLWAASTITAASYSLPVLGNKLVLPVIFDLRKFCKKPVDWTFGDHVASPLLEAKISPGDTIKDILRKFKDDYKKCVKTGRHFYSIARPVCSEPLPPNKGVTLVSSLGPVKLNKPIVDMHIQSTDILYPQSGFPIFSFSKITEKRNDLVLAFRYNQKMTSLQQMMVLVDSFRFFLTRIPLSTPVVEAFNEMKKVQKEIRSQMNYNAHRFI